MHFFGRGSEALQLIDWLRHSLGLKRKNFSLAEMGQRELKLVMVAMGILHSLQEISATWLTSEARQLKEKLRFSLLEEVKLVCLKNDGYLASPTGVVILP